jgi:redox-sensitive bicupin YhaK (pirin superfamily)
VSESSGVEILTPRDVPLGGLRAMTVRRTLPQRQRSLIGAWCFCDHYGPDDLATSEPMVVPPHPHTGLSTVSWLFSGRVEHRDSAGNHAMVLPGELNLMTAGRGISHSEYSTPDTSVLHGAQLWLALPDGVRETDPRFDHYAPGPVIGEGWQARVFLGDLLGSTSPVETHSPLLGAELVLDAGASLTIEVRAGFEHGVLVDTGAVTLDDAPVGLHELGYLAPGRERLTISAPDDSRILLLGGEPFGEQIVMWWNFIGRDHDEIVAFREQWQSLLVTGSDDRFALPDGDPRDALDAPPLPNARLRPRG